MRRTWSNWDMLQSDEGKQRLKEIFLRSIEQSGHVKIYTVLGSVLSSGMSYLCFCSCYLKRL